MTEKNKKVIFSLSENDKAKFKVQLQYDSLTQAQFLRGMIDGYLNKDSHFMNFIATLKGNLKTQSKVNLKKVEKNKKESGETIKKFALEDDEVENIFDILEREHPEL